ncbi:MAG: site-specific integrase [Melioribacteraceae bacterium]|nr:site-specific integrase [Melioribacteraceae bacterium]
MKKQDIIESFNKKLVIENYSDQTIKNYLSALKLFLEWVEKLTVAKVTEKEIEEYLFYCKIKKKYSFSSMKQIIATIRYLYLNVFNKPIPKALDLKLRKPTILPNVLSVSDISKILSVTSNIKHKTILLLIYAAGLRLGELLKLKIGDIDSDSMRIHIREGKGKKDRYIMLSENVLVLLREYLFEGQKGVILWQH